MDQLSALLAQVLKIFGVNHPVRMGVGICLGGVLSVLWKVLFAYYPESPALKVLVDTPVIYDCLAVVAIFMIPVAFGNNGAAEEVSQQVKTIELLLQTAKLSPAQSRMIWHSLIKKYVDAVKPNVPAQGKIDIVDEARKEINDQVALNKPE
jgi:hypothetical protein